MNRPMPNNPVFGTMMRNPLQMLQRLQQNPAQLLKELGLDVPADLTNPNSIIQHLMNSGQVSQQAYEQARQMASRLKK